MAGMAGLETVFRCELDHIARRREWLRSQGLIEPQVPPIDPVRLTGAERRSSESSRIGMPPRIQLQGQDAFDLVGLSLSGGGIRSASFSLGVLQALNRLGVLDRVDYLSTVSGGGYIGAALSATSCARKGGFAFDRQQGRSVPEHRDISDTKPVRHIRNHSRYLMPCGAKDLVQNAALFARGLVTNVLVVLPYLLLMAALTLLYNPTPESLRRFGPDWLAHLGQPYWLEGLGHAAWPVLLSGMVAFLLFGWSLWRSTGRGSTLSEFSGGTARIAGAALLGLVATLFLSFQNGLLDGAVHNSGGIVAASRSGFAFVASMVAIAGLMGVLLRGRLALIGVNSAKLVVVAVAAAVPLVLWLVYLAVVHAGLTCTASRCAWFLAHSAGLPPAVQLLGYAALGLVLTYPLEPNAHSLHRLYRDRLERAFIVDPDREDARSGDLQPFARNLRLSGLVNGEGFVFGPFPILNAALNVHGSPTVNRRGRNADFFSFSPLFAGSAATGFVPVERLERADRTLDLAAVTAISGAAAAANMGSLTMRPLSLTLALLNVRLGYWLANPAWLTRHGRRRVRKRPLIDDLWFLWDEMTSGLDETKPFVYLTDGGHIENLGAYELLRRRCKLIVAVDVDADPDMDFRSLVTLQRHAGIDLGIRIDLPWDAIRRHTRAVMAAHAGCGDGEPGEPRPQAALGRILYDDGTEGLLLYLKASLSGGENDYVRSYARRNPSFPHETTADQFFSEEQFEVYRALGFAVAHGALGGTVPLATWDEGHRPIAGPLPELRERSEMARALLAMLAPLSRRSGPFSP